MADNSILTPGYPEEDIPVVLEPEKYLAIEKYLSEFSTQEAKDAVLSNLGAVSANNVYSKLEVDVEISKKISAAKDDHLATEDPHNILSSVKELLLGAVKNDGSVSFTGPQGGKDPTLPYHLTTRQFVENLLKQHTGNVEDPHKTLDTVLDILASYIKIGDTYNKSQLYTKQEVNKITEDSVKRDGTIPFIKALIGVDPIVDSHLSTKRYVDKSIYNHLIDVDPHGFLKILNDRLANFAKKKDFYDKTLTYSRTQIDNLIYSIVDEAIDASIKDFMDEVDSKFDHVRLLKYIKLDGSIPFRSPQIGVDAVEDNHLVTLRQVTEAVQGMKDTIHDRWITSGPVEATVGLVLENTQLPESMSLLETMDAIFYGKSISINTPDNVTITDKCDITLCVHGSLAQFERAEVLLNDKVIHIITSKEMFENGCITLDSEPILEDTTFTFKVYYTNGSIHEETTVTFCSYPVFVGLLPKWKQANTITMEYLQELAEQDSEKTLNQFLSFGKDVESISFKYSFQDSTLRNPFLVIPASYPDLESMTTKSQDFGIEAFEIVDRIPLSIEGIEEDVIFKVYVYKQALSSLNLEVTFNFVQE